MTGDLKVRDIVQSVTFDVTATLTSEDQLQGTASAQVTRDQFNLTIPTAPGVANVSNDVRLEIDFVATKVQA
jgi:polyisoprenoid-binding protein YceI